MRSETVCWVGPSIASTTSIVNAELWKKNAKKSATQYKKVVGIIVTMIQKIENLAYHHPIL